MSEPGGSRVGAARTGGGWKRWTGAVRLGLAVLAWVFAGEGAAQTYTNLDSAINTLVRELVKDAGLREKKVFVGADDFYEEKTELRLPLSSILLTKCRVALNHHEVGAALIESDAVLVLHGRWRRQGEHLHLTLFIATPVRKGDPIAVAAREGLVPIDEDIERDITPTLRDWGRAVVKRLERGVGVRGSLTVQLEPFPVENEALAGSLDNWLGEALAGSDKLLVVEPVPGVPVQSEGRLLSEVDIHGEYVEVALRVVDNKGRRVGFVSVKLAKTLFPDGIIDPFDVTARLKECAGRVDASRLSEARGCYEGLEDDALGDERVRKEVEAGLERIQAVSKALVGADKALNRGEVRKAKGYVEELRELAGGHPRLGELETRIEELEEKKPKLELELAERKDVQRGLSSLGWDVGPIDGLFGSRTREALRAWQSERGLDETGYLTKQQSEVLIAEGREAKKRADRLEKCAGHEKAGRLSEARGCYEGLEADAPEDARVREEVEDGLARVKEKELVRARAVNEALAGAEEALNRGEVWKAKGHVEELRRLAGGHPRLGELEARIEELEELEKRYPPGKWFRDCAECPLMVVVPPGEFMMGSPESEAGRLKYEGPVHRVRIERPFAVGVYEVTFAEWDACMSGGGCGGYRPSDGGWGRGNRPVIHVSWEDAKAYVRWLSRKTGEEYRLLSESEWEYVARGGTETARYWGESETGQCGYENGADLEARKKYYGGKEAAADCNDGYVWTSPVGSFGENGFGLHDVLGNVSEWVEDCWNGGYRRAPADGSAWETGDCSRRVLRGGSWYYVPGGLRSAVRDWLETGNRRSSLGFRVARTLTP